VGVEALCVGDLGCVHQECAPRLWVDPVGVAAQLGLMDTVVGQVVTETPLGVAPLALGWVTRLPYLPCHVTAPPPLSSRV
jgi:hypothetical protein